MRIISQDKAMYVSKPEGTNVWYYLRDEYELHYNEQIPKSIQIWHHHNKVAEIIFIIDGELVAEWKENGQIKKQIVKKGDLIETENTPHTFINNTNKNVKFIVLKQVLSNKNIKELLKNDKIIDQS